jgi:hypothetical protein
VSSQGNHAVWLPRKRDQDRIRGASPLMRAPRLALEASHRHKNLVNYRSRYSHDTPHNFAVSGEHHTRN